MDQLTAPPELTPEKMEELRGLLRAELLDGAADASPADEEDADMLLDYATDMIEGDENVGHVIEELKFMELPLCDEEVAFNLGVIMMKYFVELEMAGSGATGGEDDASELEAEPSQESEDPEPLAPVPTEEKSKEAATVEDDDPVPAATISPAVPDGEPSEKLTPLEERELQKQREKEEKEARMQAQKKDLPSLKQRMAAFQGGDAAEGGTLPLPPEPKALSAARMSWIKAEPKEEAPKKKEQQPKALTAGRKSWNSAKDSDDAAKAESVEKLPSEQEEKQQQKQEQKGTSLKQRLAAYQNASTKRVPQEQEEESAEGGDVVPEEGTGKDEPPHPVVDAAPIGLSLKQRMAAFQGGGAEPAATVEEEASSAASVPEGEEGHGIDGTPISMKDRLAAYQRRMAATEEEGGGEEKGEANPKARAPAKDPAREEKRRSLQDRMAAFGGAATAPKPKPKKELSGVQQRMAMFSAKSSSAASNTGSETARKGLPPKAKGGGGSALRERLAKYAETAGVGNPENFVVPKKAATAKAKRRTFTAKKPKGGLQSRMQAFQGATAEGVSDEKEPSKESVPEGDKKEGKKWKYQSKGLSGAGAPKAKNAQLSQPTPLVRPETVADGSPPAAPAPEQPAAVDLKTRLSMYQANAAASQVAAAGKGVAGIVGTGDLKGRASASQPPPEASPDAAAEPKVGEAAGAVPPGGTAGVALQGAVSEEAAGDDIDARDSATASGDAAAPSEAIGKEDDIENKDLNPVPAQDETLTPVEGLNVESAIATPVEDVAPPDAIPDEQVGGEDSPPKHEVPSEADFRSFHDFEQFIATPIKDVAPHDTITDELVGKEDGLSKTEVSSETSEEDLQSFQKFQELIAIPVEDVAS